MGGGLGTRNLYLLQLGGSQLAGEMPALASACEAVSFKAGDEAGLGFGSAQSFGRLVFCAELGTSLFLDLLFVFSCSFFLGGGERESALCGILIIH